MPKNYLMCFVSKVLWPHRKGNVITDIGFEKNAAEDISFGLDVSWTTKSRNILLILAIRLVSCALAVPALLSGVQLNPEQTASHFHETHPFRGPLLHLELLVAIYTQAEYFFIPAHISSNQAWLGICTKKSAQASYLGIPIRNQCALWRLVSNSIFFTACRNNPDLEIALNLARKTYFHRVETDLFQRALQNDLVWGKQQDPVA